MEKILIHIRRSFMCIMHVSIYIYIYIYTYLFLYVAYIYK